MIIIYRKLPNDFIGGALSVNTKKNALRKNWVFPTWRRLFITIKMANQRKVMPIGLIRSLL